MSSFKDFPIDTLQSNISEITLSERYPAKGNALNTESEMVVYILNGKVKLNQENNSKILENGDVVLIKINSKYNWEPMNEVTLLIFSTPPWSIEQQRIFEL